MPPKVKFSKEAMIGTALQLVREEGIASLTARALAEKLGATPRVIFGQFDPIRRFQDFLPMKDHSYQMVLDSIVADYPLTLEEASRLYQHLFIYSHGMASMVASGIYQFSMEEVIGLLTEVCQSLIKEMVGKK